MKCKEFEYQISAAVDHELSKEEMDSFQDHACRCPSCRGEYELELATKLVLHNRARMVHVPVSLRETIVREIEQQTVAPPPFAGDRIAPFLRHPLLKPSLAFAAAAVAVTLLLTGHSPDPPMMVPPSIAASDVIYQSVTNYHAVLQGNVTPQMVSSEPEQMQSFFGGKTEFPVHVPTMSAFTLISGVLNNHRGAPLAHMVYRHDDTILYVYQACWKTVQQGDRLSLSEDARNQLLTTGWFTGQEPDGDAVVAWTKEGTLCVAVARMDKDNLAAVIKNFDPSGRGRW